MPLTFPLTSLLGGGLIQARQHSTSPPAASPPCWKTIKPTAIKDVSTANKPTRRAAETRRDSRRRRVTEAAASTNQNTANTFSVHSLALHLQTAALAAHVYHKQLTNCSSLSFLGGEQAHLAPKNPPNLTAKEDPTEQNREEEPAGRKREIWRRSAD